MRISTTTTPAHNSLSSSKNSKSKSLSTKNKNSNKQQYTTVTSPSIEKSKTVSSAPGSPSPSKSIMTTATAESSSGGTTIELPLPSDASGSSKTMNNGVPLLAKCSTDASELEQDQGQEEHLEQQQQQQELPHDLPQTSVSARLGAVPEEDVAEDGKSDVVKEEDEEDNNSMDTFPTFPQNPHLINKENNSNGSGSKSADKSKATSKAKVKAAPTPRSSDSTSRRSKSKKQEPLTTVGMISSACIPSSPMRHAADSAGFGHANAGALAGTNAGLPASPRSTRGSQAHKSTASNSITLTRQQSILHESGKMLEYARKEVHKLRSKNAQLNTDFQLLKDNNQRLIDANCSLGDTCDTLNSHAKTLSKANHKLKSDAKRKVERVKKELMESKNHVGHLNTTITELKEELKMKHGSYIGEVQSRLQYQKAMAKIVETIQIKCRDHRLVETILSMCDDCEELHDC